MELALAPAAAIAVAAGLGVELRLFASSRTPRRGEAVVWSIGWLLLAVAIAVGIALTDGPAGEWSTVYLIERSLSLDNVFLFSLLLAYFFVPTELRGRVIVIGIAGALVLRAVAIAGGVALVESVEAVVYAFGALLLYVAYRTFRGAAEESDPSANPVLRLVRRIIPTTPDFRGRHLLVREGGRLYGTPLLLVVVAIIAADIAFAVDSIPAAFAVTHDPVVIWTANAFALLGLGSLLVLVEILVRRFRYLGKDDRAHSRLRRDQDPRCRSRPHQRSWLARRHRRPPRRRCLRLTRCRSTRPAPPGRRGHPTSASLPAAARAPTHRDQPSVEESRRVEAIFSLDPPSVLPN